MLNCDTNYLFDILRPSTAAPANFVSNQLSFEFQFIIRQNNYQLLESQFYTVRLFEQSKF